MELVKLSDQISEYFNSDELADLCYRLKINFEDLAGETHTARVRELTQYCRRHGRLDDLLAACRKLRPHVLWADVPDSSASQTTEQVFGTPPTAGAGANVPGSMPAGTLPPQLPGMFWMPYPDTWYGPFFGYFIGWMSTGGFQVWHPMMGPVAYPDPYRQIQRNIWIRLYNSPFNVYVDGGPSGHVFAQYSPY